MYIPGRAPMIVSHSAPQLWRLSLPKIMTIENWLDNVIVAREATRIKRKTA
jgi:hypothetical protein